MGVIAARAPMRFWLAAGDKTFHPGELFFLFEQRFLGEWDQQIM